VLPYLPIGRDGRPVSVPPPAAPAEGGS
jgi:hypothetical protein